MKRTLSLIAIFMLIVVAVISSLPTGTTSAQDDEFVFGLIMVGPFDDNGWSEAHYDAGLYVEDNVEGARMVWIDKFNAADSPELTMEDVVADMVEQGAQLIIANSDDMKEDIEAVAADYPDVAFVHVSGDGALTGEAPENLSNIMGEMIYGKMIAGCVAGLRTETGRIGYLGPLVNAETRRLANSAYLGAKHCYEMRGEDPAALEFEVVWIGFWFKIEGVTLDPTEVANDFFNNGADVIISGIDTTEALVVAGQRAAEGETVWAIPYDYVDSCNESPDVCLGVPYFNWGPSYVEAIEKVRSGEWEQYWEWNAPDWEDINNPDTSAVGFEFGETVTEEEQAMVQEFIDGLAAAANEEEGGLNLYVGPLNYQDGSVFVEDGATAAQEDIWYTEQLLEGMEGSSE